MSIIITTVVKSSLPNISDQQKESKDMACLARWRARLVYVYVCQTVASQINIAVLRDIVTRIFTAMYAPLLE